MTLGYKLFGGFVLLAVFVALWQWLWYQPELWNGAAGGYTTHVAKLEKDSVRWHGDSLGFVGIIAKKDSIVARRDSTIQQLTSDWKKALAYGEQWKQSYAMQVVASDATADRLSYSEQERAYYKGLFNNGTLSRLNDIAALHPADSAVINAGLKTVKREALGAATMDSLAKVAALYRVRNERLATGLKTASGNLAMIAQSARDKAAHGGIWPFNRKRKKQLRAVAENAESAKVEVDKEGELEGLLNH